MKKSLPIRFWVWDTVPDFYRAHVVSRYRNAKNWIRFRTWDRYDLLRLEVPKDYHDPDYRLTHANFQVLKDFVEIELASMTDTDEESEGEEISSFLRKFGKRFRRNRRKKIRQPELGIKYLDWEISATTGQQSTEAKEKKALYLWWTTIRPFRGDLYGVMFDDPNDDPTVPIFNQSVNWDRARARNELESFFFKEDEEMLCRLIRIRGSLWT